MGYTRWRRADSPLMKTQEGAAAGGVCSSREDKTVTLGSPSTVRTHTHTHAETELLCPLRRRRHCRRRRRHPVLDEGPGRGGPPTDSCMSQQQRVPEATRTKSRTRAPQSALRLRENKTGQPSRKEIHGGRRISQCRQRGRRWTPKALVMEGML